MASSVDQVFRVLIILAFVLFSAMSVEDLESVNAFRMGKVNAVWNKAIKNIPKGKLRSSLYAELLVQDRKERELKLRKTQGTDKDGLFEAEVRENMAEILEKFNLSPHFPHETVARRTKDKIDSKFKAYEVKDKKLKTLMKNAYKEGFSEAEIELLKEELGHHQLKMDEYETLKEEFESLHDKVDNSLDNVDEQDEVFRKLDAKRKVMKEKHQELKSNYRNLEGRVADPQNKEGKFEDERVYHLWALAQKAGLDEQELESLRTELAHFENRIRKSQYIEDRLKKTQNKIDRGEEINLQEHENLKEKAQLYNKKVDKYHDDLKQRIHRRLDEL